MVRRITQSQFDTFQEIHEIMKVKHAELLHEWYEFDSNAVPPCYSLRASDTIQSYNYSTNLYSAPTPYYYRAMHCKARYCDCMSSVCLSVCLSVRL